MESQTAIKMRLVCPLTDVEGVVDLNGISHIRRHFLQWYTKQIQIELINWPEIGFEQSLPEFLQSSPCWGTRTENARRSGASKDSGLRISLSQRLIWSSLVSDGPWMRGTSFSFIPSPKPERQEINAKINIEKLKVPKSFETIYIVSFLF